VRAMKGIRERVSQLQAMSIVPEEEATVLPTFAGPQHTKDLIRMGSTVMGMASFASPVLNESGNSWQVTPHWCNGLMNQVRTAMCYRAHTFNACNSRGFSKSQAHVVPKTNGSLATLST
jgi:predicted extracellular nuclease